MKGYIYVLAKELFIIINISTELAMYRYYAYVCMP